MSSTANNNQTPQWMTIREVAKAGILSEYNQRLRVKQGRLPGIYTGRVFRVNVPLLLEQLEMESRANANNGQVQ